MKTMFESYPLQGEIGISSGFTISKAFFELATSKAIKSAAILKAAKKQAKEMLKPKEQIIIKNSSNRLNHLHAIKEIVYV